MNVNHISIPSRIIHRCTSFALKHLYKDDALQHRQLIMRRSQDWLANFYPSGTPDFQQSFLQMATHDQQYGLHPSKKKSHPYSETHRRYPKIMGEYVFTTALFHDNPYECNPWERNHFASLGQHV